jgi:hypothetical protein
MTSSDLGVGAAQRPFVDRPVADLGAAGRVARRAARSWGLPEPELLRVGMNAIYRAGAEVLRVGHPTVTGDAAIRLARCLSGAGIPVVEPTRDDVFVDDGFTVTCWQHLDVLDSPIDWPEVGRIVRRVHLLDPARLPADYPIPSPRSFAWWDFESLLAELASRIDDAALRGLRAAIDRHPRWWAGDDPVICHGDVHPGNVVMVASGPVLIDWDLMCRAPIGWDHGPLMTWAQRWGGDPEGYPRFAAGYGADLRRDPAAQALAELRLVAATLLRVRAAAADPRAGDEVERRLRYWRGDPDAPAWRAQ